MNELTAKVKVIRPGVFLGRGLKALPPAAEGDLIHVAAGGYAESLADDGWVELVVDTPAVVEAPTETAPLDTEVETNTPAGNEAGLAEGESEVVVAEPSPEPTQEADPVQDFVRLNGVGTSTAHKLVDAGYTLTTFATEDPQKLRVAVGGSVKRIEEWQAEAKRLLSH